MTEDERVQALEACALGLSQAALRGDMALSARMEVPQVGDLVMEITSLIRGQRGAEDRRVGVLRRKAQTLEDADVVECDDGTEQRWINARFIALPRTVSELLAWRRG